MSDVKIDWFEKARQCKTVSELREAANLLSDSFPRCDVDFGFAHIALGELDFSDGVIKNCLLDKADITRFVNQKINDLYDWNDGDLYGYSYDLSLFFESISATIDFLKGLLEVDAGVRDEL